MSLSKSATHSIEQKAAKLEQFYDHIIGCRVMVETPHRHKNQGSMFNVRIDLTVPGGELIVKREPNQDVYVAIRDAFDAAQRQLKSYAHRRRGDVKTHANNGAGDGIADMEKISTGVAISSLGLGHVSKVYVEEGFGYLETEDGREVYFNDYCMMDGELDSLEVGMPVRFGENFATRPGQATEVMLR
jgi:ribosomal subunit interface protein